MLLIQLGSMLAAAVRLRHALMRSKMLSIASIPATAMRRVSAHAKQDAQPCLGFR